MFGRGRRVSFIPILSESQRTSPTAGWRFSPEQLLYELP